MAPSVTLQSTILTLQRFWADRGCLIWQPYYTQLGAGTMNPATFLRVLGPEPWRVAYVEPSIRPDDGRYGENPNRLQQFYQYQVILKPDPGDPVELYLDSLRAIGVDPTHHDLRFVEDRWESPALGAWGLGWEVWLDGQEITQFTYFQQAGGQILDPVSVEITYGLERILIGLLALDHFEKIPWNDDRTYGDVLRRAEQEHTGYYLDHADVERTRAAYDLSAAEAAASLEHGLVLPAYDHLLKCSHAFNILDARGGVGVAERAVLFGQMRDLARRVADAYLGQRSELGFPWRRPTPALPPRTADLTPPPVEAQDFVLEIGTEELPTGDLAAALAALPDLAIDLLATARLKHGAVRASGTPRRLILEVEALIPAQPDLSERVKGPPEARAFDADGTPTRAALGWAAKMGLDREPAALRALVRDIDGGRYLAADIRRDGRPASTVLADAVLPKLISAIPFDQTMRWIGSGDDSGADQALRRTAFARPIRWLLALHGEHVVPFAYAGLPAGRLTRGLRFAEPATSVVERAADFGRVLAETGVVADPDDRRREIRQQGDRLAAEVGGVMDPDPALLEEVGHLVEAPYVVRGSFDAGYLDLPAEVLTAVMKKHQRYFPIRSADGRLLASFLAVGNGVAATPDTVRQGNEHVLRARFTDAAFFLAKDRAHPLEWYRQHLDRLTFHARLGSMLEKTERLESLAPGLAETIGVGAAHQGSLRRAARLCKADLATALVTEMTSLQGILGRTYALESGEPEAVAQAILEHYLPRFSGDALPESPEGVVLSLADRLDTLAGLFAVGEQPSGAKDPLGMRRAALGLVSILVGRGLRADLRRWLEMASAGLPLRPSEASMRACLEFIVARQEALLLAEGHRYDAVGAALSAQGHDPAGAAEAVTQLEAAAAAPDWPPVLQAYARCARIVRGQKADGAVDPAAFEMDAERELASAVETVGRPVVSVDRLVAALRELVPPISEFFDRVLVMDEDPRRRANRLALVRRVVDLADGVADLSMLEGF